MTVGVLCYHDLARPGERHSWLKLDVLLFERQILALRRIARFIRPDELLEPVRPAKGKLHLLMTFDDGLVNNFRLGLPVLQCYGIPAMFFISTWHMQIGEPFWFDRLIRAIQQRRLTELDLRHRGLKRYVFSPVGGEVRWNGIQQLLEDIKRGDEKQDGGLTKIILDGLDGDWHFADKPCEDDRPLNGDEILAMRDSGLCWFGSHSHHHRRLTLLDDETLIKELEQSRDLLAGLLGGPVEHIAYPNGDVDGRVREACQGAGYRFGYTVAPGRIGAAVDQFLIPRILVGGFDTPWRLLLNLGRGLLKPGPAGI